MIPNWMQVVMVFIFGVGIAIAIIVYGAKKGLQYSFLLMLALYLSLLLSATVFLRTFNGYNGYDFHPFWSYVAISGGRVNLITDNIMNVAAFVPVGLLLCCMFKGMRWWMVLLIGGSVSLTIEALQFMYKCGFSEVDDVMHNVVGCLIGCWIFSLVYKGYEKISKSHLTIL